MINRRNLIGAGALGVAGAAATFSTPKAGAVLATPAITRNRRRLNMVTTWPKGLPGLGMAAERVAQQIGDMTDGIIEIKVFAAGELVPAFECFDAVANGSADLYHGVEYYWTGKSPAYPFFSSVPFGMTAPELMGWIDYGGGQQLWDELSAQFGIKAFQAGNTGPQMGGWFRKEIRSLSDMAGLRMRIPGQGGEVLRALGGASVSLPGGEIYQALQTGAIDAAEWVGPWNDYALGFHREAPFYYGPAFQEPGPSLAVGINLGVWNDLSLSEQTIIRTACDSANHHSLGEFTYQNSVHLDLLVREHGTQLRTFPEDVVKRMAEAAFDIRAASGRSGIEKKIYESYERTLKLVRGWAEVSDRPYYNARAISK